MARPFPWKCRTCGQQKVNPTLLPDYKAELEHDGRAYPVTVPDLQVLECEACKTRVLPDEAHRRLAIALRTAAGLLAPEEIKARRARLGLTQKQLAQYLKVAESTVCRWEKGAQIQQRPMDLLLRAFFDVPALQWYLGMVPTMAVGVTVTAPMQHSRMTPWTALQESLTSPFANRQGGVASYTSSRLSDYWEGIRILERRSGQ